MRVLIVEDEALIAMDMAEVLTDAGHEIVGVKGTVKAALETLNKNSCEAAVLDANLRGDSSVPVADALRARCIPFLIVSGYGDDICAKVFDHENFLAKPYTVDALVTAVHKLGVPAR